MVKKHNMRPSEKGIILLCVVIFIIMLGRGVFAEYVNDIHEAFNILTMLGKHGEETSGAMTALVIGAFVFINSLMGRKKRRG